MIKSQKTHKLIEVLKKRDHLALLSLYVGVVVQQRCTINKLLESGITRSPALVSCQEIYLKQDAR